MVLDLLRVPAAADAEEEAAPGNHVQARHVLRRLDRVSLNDEADAGPEQETLGDRGRRGQGDEGIDHVVVHLRNRVPTGPGRVAMHGHVRMLGEPQRFESTLLGGLGELHRSRRVVGGEHRNCVLHKISRGAWGTSFQNSGS